VVVVGDAELDRVLVCVVAGRAVMSKC
jgi:hypothetical protein